ncbi:MAG: ABC transporter substrate-binding protein [Clostridia bacterium]|nr:ABC transporter substrate-binding protein [Clostridia bacterium]
MLLMLLMGLMLVTATACGEKQVVLNVYNWGDYIDETILDDFEAEYGIKVNYEMFASNEDMYVKIKQGGTKYDVAFPSDYMIEKMIKEDMLESFDAASLENYPYIGEKFKGLSYDPDNQYSVPYLWGTVGMVYNKDMVDEADMKSWDVLFNEKYKGQILMYDSQRDALAVAFKTLGYSLNSTDPKELEAAKQLLINQKDLVLAYVTDNVKGIMLSEEAAIGVDYSGDAFMILLEGGLDKFGYVVPEEGSNMWFDAMVIPKGAEHVEEAKLFIDYMSRPDVALKNVEYVQYSTPNVEAVKNLSDELKSIPYAYPSDEELDNCEVFVDPGTFVEEYNKAWVEIKAN